MADDVLRRPMDLKLLPPLETPYLDASVFLAHVKEEPHPAFNGRPRFEITTNILEGARQVKYVIYTSFLTIAEVRRLRESKKELDSSELLKINALFADFLEHEWIMPIEVSREIAEKAQELGAIYGMAPTDAIHLASAILNKCNVLMVWDKPRFSDLFKDGPIEGVHVLEPYWEGIVLAPLAPPPEQVVTDDKG